MSGIDPRLEPGTGRAALPDRGGSQVAACVGARYGGPVSLFFFIDEMNQNVCV